MHLKAKLQLHRKKENKMHARIENNEVVEYPIVNLAQRLPHLSLPADLTNDQILPEGFVYVNPADVPAYDVSAQAIDGSVPVKMGEKWFIQYTIRNLSAAEKTELTLVKSNEIRALRNEKLAECDWTQLGDATVDKSAWAAYRQALRDITAQTGFPWSVQWPSMPA